MKILLDEMCGYLEHLLIEMGYTVITVKKLKELIDIEEGENSLNDKQIIKYAEENKCIIVTRDYEFNNKCLIKNIPYIDLNLHSNDAIVVDANIKRMKAWKEYL